MAIEASLALVAGPPRLFARVCKPRRGIGQTTWQASKNSKELFAFPRNLLLSCNPVNFCLNQKIISTFFENQLGGVRSFVVTHHR